MQLISFLLGPATVALAYSVYRQRQILKQHFIPIFCGCLVGSIVSMISAYTLCELLGLGDEMATSFIPKSVTTPIAIAVSEQLGGITSITVAAVIITGILGAIFAPLMSKIFRVNNRIAKGVAIGTCSHAVGTTKALEMGELEGAMSGVSIAVSGLLTTAIVIIASCFVYGVFPDALALAALSRPRRTRKLAATASIPASAPAKPAENRKGPYGFPNSLPTTAPAFRPRHAV